MADLSLLLLSLSGAVFSCRLRDFDFFDLGGFAELVDDFLLSHLDIQIREGAVFGHRLFELFGALATLGGEDSDSSIQFGFIDIDFLFRRDLLEDEEELEVLLAASRSALPLANCGMFCCNWLRGACRASSGRWRATG